MQTTSPVPVWRTVKDLLHQLGDIPAERVRLWPLPGTATEEDVLAVRASEDRLCELVDGVLVEKAVGYPESRLALWLAYLLQAYLDQHDLGALAGADGCLQLLPGLIRIPDLSFISWQRLPNRSILRNPIPDLGPDLAVEVLSPGNTEDEMQRKVKDYFFAHAQQVWLIDPRQQTVRVYTAPDQVVTLRDAEVLDGGAVLPGFTLSVERLFSKL